LQGGNEGERDRLQGLVPGFRTGRPQTDLTGAGDYMTGLIAYAQPIVPGSVRILASTGDERNALLTLTMTLAGGPFGTGATAPCARLYLLDDNDKIKTEHVIFYVAQSSPEPG
jgi:hypothetical protein